MTTLTEQMQTVARLRDALRREVDKLERMLKQASTAQQGRENGAS